MSRHYSKEILRWDQLWQDFPKNIIYKPNSKLIDEILSLFQKKIANIKILEVGAGSGSDSVSLAKHGAKSHALDFSSEALKVCQALAKKQKVKIGTVQASCEQIPYRDEFFSLVFSAGLIEHFKNPLLVIKEQLRVLKKGGYLLIDVPQKYNPYTTSKHIRMFFKTHPFGWETEYTSNDLKKFVPRLNIKLIKIYGRDSAISNHLPKIIDNYWKKVFSKIESSKLAPYVCLHIGAIYQKR